jgi:hypothetical protein
MRLICNKGVSLCVEEPEAMVVVGGSREALRLLPVAFAPSVLLRKCGSSLSFGPTQPPWAQVSSNHPPFTLHGQADLAGEQEP